jgi:hypothetical protein
MLIIINNRFKFLTEYVEACNFAEDTNVSCNKPDIKLYDCKLLWCKFYLIRIINYNFPILVSK